MKPEELKFELVRAMEKLGFSVREVEGGLIGTGDSETVKVTVRDIGPNLLGIPQTEAVFECGEEVYKKIIVRLSLSEWGDKNLRAFHCSV